MASFGIGNIFGIPDKGRSSAVMCSCPACTGLECLERPRFFAGQLLSEADFNSEIDYILAKQRLHNRYLHGEGTVCGLEVVCSNCKGQVIIKPGYAIDPCGNDIIVCQEQQFDVVRAIKACCDARKKKSKMGCDPYQPASDPGCSGVIQHWCITIEYKETPTQPVTPLRGRQKSCSCGCGSSSCGCGCGNGSSNGNSMAGSNGCSSISTSSASSVAAPVSCEPTRILESYQLGVIDEPDNCRKPSLEGALFSNLSLEGTLFSNLVQCAADALGFLKKLPAASTQIIGLALNHQLDSSQTSNADAYAACCQFRQFMIDLFTNSEIATRCALLKKFGSIMCPTLPKDATGATVGGTNSQYLGQVQDSIDATGNALFAYMGECFCYQLLPPCPPDPGDDRLILACVTIQNGEIVDICNFGCRKFAGAFPSLFYWLSAIPIVPIIKLLITELCCGIAKVPHEGLDTARVLFESRTATMDVGKMPQAFSEGNFALPKMVFEKFGDLAQKFSLRGIASTVPANALNLATLKGMSLQNAQNSLNSFGVSFDVQQVNSRAEIPLFSQGLGSPLDWVVPFARSGDHVTIYQIQGSVADVQRASGANPQVLILQKQVDAMKADLEVLKGKK